MSYSAWVSPVSGHKITIHWRSRLARLGGANNCMTPCAGHILVSDSDINAETLCHEDGHEITAAKRGVFYLLWVAWAFVFNGYERSKAEREAEEHRSKYVHRYTGLKEGT